MGIPDRIGAILPPPEHAEPVDDTDRIVPFANVTVGRKYAGIIAVLVLLIAIGFAFSGAGS